MQPLGDVFVPYDITRLSRLNFALRAERAREVVVVSFKEGERRIDVTTGALLDEKRAIFPVPRAFEARLSPVARRLCRGL